MAICFIVTIYVLYSKNSAGDLCDCQHQSNSEMWNNLKKMFCSNSLNTVVLGCLKNLKIP